MPCIISTLRKKGIDLFRAISKKKNEKKIVFMVDFMWSKQHIQAEQNRKKEKRTRTER